jgi:hypothetical protein
MNKTDWVDNILRDIETSPIKSWSLGESTVVDLAKPSKQVKINLTKESDYEEFKMIPYLFAFILTQQVEMSNLKKEFDMFKNEVSAILDKKDLDFDNVVKQSPALQVFIKNKTLSTSFKKMILKNREKIERLYKNENFQLNLDEFKGMLEIKDGKIASDFLD